MGSWNQTCGVSQLPILGGEKVVSFLITQTGIDSGGDQFCYPTDVWAPRTIQIYGEYDTYGSIENVADDWHLKFILAQFQKDLVEKKQGKNQYHDIAVTKKGFDLEKIMEAIHEGRLEVKQSNVETSDEGCRLSPGTAKVGHIMVLQKVFDALVDRGIDNWRGFMSLKSVFEKLITQWREAKTECALAPDKDKFIVSYGIKDKIRNMYASHRESGYLDIGIDTYFEHIFDEDYIAAHTEEEVYPIAMELSKFHVFHNNFAALRKSWAPQCGGGSQDQDFDLYLYLNDVVNQHIKEHKAEWAAENGDDDEEFLDEEDGVQAA